MSAAVVESVNGKPSDVSPQVLRTHFIAYRTVERSVFHGRSAARLLAVCGESIPATLHSPHPTCESCAAYVACEAADDEETYRALGYVRVSGFWVLNDGRAL